MAAVNKDADGAPLSSSSSSSSSCFAPAQSPPTSRNAFAPTRQLKTVDGSAGGGSNRSAQSAETVVTAAAAAAVDESAGKEEADEAARKSVAAFFAGGGGNTSTGNPVSAPQISSQESRLLYQKWEGRRVLALSRQLREAAADLESERQGLAQAQQRHLDLERELAQLRQSKSTTVQRHIEQASVRTALREGELGLLAEQQLAAAKWRQRLEAEGGTARAALQFERETCLRLARDNSETLDLVTQAREAAKEARQATQRDALLAAAVKDEAAGARASALSAAFERAVALEARELAFAELAKHQALLPAERQGAAEAEKLAADAHAELEAARARSAALGRAKHEASAALAQSQAEAEGLAREVERAHRDRLAFAASRRDALEARRAMLVGEVARAEKEAWASAVLLAREQEAAAAESTTHARLNVCTSQLRRQMERESVELQQLVAFEAERCEAHARGRRDAWRQLEHLARVEAGLRDALAADRASASHESTRLLGLEQQRRREMRDWLRLSADAEAATAAAGRATEQRARAGRQADAARASMAGEGEGADRLGLELFFLRRATAAAVAQRGVLDSKAERWRRRLRLERAAAAELRRRASRAANERRETATQVRNAGDDKQRAEIALAADMRELERLGRETAGLEAARTQTLERARELRRGGGGGFARG